MTKLTEPTEPTELTELTELSDEPDPTERWAEKLADDFASDDLDVSGATVWTHPALSGLIDAVQAKAEAEAAIVAEVRQARAAKVPWAMIAGVLGVSHQAAMKRFKPLLTA